MYKKISKTRANKKISNNYNNNNSGAIPKLFTVLLVLFISLTLLPLLTQEIIETLPSIDNQEIFLEQNYAGDANTAVLLLHGLTATPWELKKLAYFLHEQDLTVLVPVIAGHNSALSDLEKTNWEDWFDSASDAYDRLAEKSNNIFVLGVSNGALLALDLAEEKEPAPRGIISIAAPFKFTNPLAELTLIAKYLQRYSDHSVEGDEIGHYYNIVPTRSIAEIILLRKNVDKQLNSLYTPILIIQSENDPTAHPSSANYLYDNIASEQKAVIMRTEEEHVLVSDRKDDLYNAIFEFIDLNV